MVFYKILLNQRENITGSMAIVYSTLVGQSILNGEVFDCDGAFDYEAARQFIYDQTENGAYFIDLPSPRIGYLSRHTGMTKQNVRLTIRRLDEAGYIGIKQESIYCPVNLLDEGFIKIPNDTHLKGWQLIDYAIMKERSIGHNNTIDTWASKLAENLHTTKENVYMTIMRLKEKGYVERLPNGNLRIK